MATIHTRSPKLSFVGNGQPTVRARAVGVVFTEDIPVTAGVALVNDGRTRLSWLLRAEGGTETTKRLSLPVSRSLHFNVQVLRQRLSKTLRHLFKLGHKSRAFWKLALIGRFKEIVYIENFTHFCVSTPT